MENANGMRRREFIGGGAGLVLGGSLLGAGCGVGQEKASKEAVTKVVPAKVDGDLLIFNWTEYMDPALIKAFEKQYDVKVRQSNFDSMPSMMAKLRAGNEYDLIFPTADYVNRLVKANMLLQLDREKLKNADGIYPFFDDPWYDDGSAHTVPYAMYTTGIAWRDDKAEGISGSWNDLANESAKGRTFMLDDFQEGIGQANLLNGFDLNATAPEELEKTKATLEHQKEFLRGYSTNAAPQLLSGNAWIHHAWNGDIINTRNQAKKNPEIYKFETCKEGIPVGSDCMAIPSNAKSPGTALLFIDWILDPEHASQNIAWFGYPMPIEGSEAAFAELAKDDPAIEVSTEDLATGSQFKELSPEDRKAWDRVWTEVKA